MIQYNYYDEHYQGGVKGLQEAAKRMPVIVMEPLLGGKLANGLPKEALGVFKQANPLLSPAGWALHWLWDQEAVTQVLSGMNTIDQLEENLRLADASRVGMVNEAERRFRINQTNVDIAARNYRIFSLRFENGDITGQELSLEQTRLSQVQLDYINAYVAYQLALSDLKRKTMWDFEGNRSYLMNNE
jgi:hypothetical protein